MARAVAAAAVLLLLAVAGGAWADCLVNAGGLAFDLSTANTGKCVPAGGAASKRASEGVADVVVRARGAAGGVRAARAATCRW